MIEAQAIGAAVIAVAAFGAGWKVQGWRWDAANMHAERERAQAILLTREREHEMANVQATIAETLEKEKANALRKKDRVIADLRSGTISLRDPMPMPQAGSSPPAPAKCDGGTPAHVLRPFLESAATLFAEADDVAVQLQACQAILRTDRGK